MMPEGSDGSKGTSAMGIFAVDALSERRAENDVATTLHNS